MGARFIVPWRTDDGHRAELWDHCRKRWSQGLPDVPIVEGSSPAGPFNRSAAINAAAEGPWDVGVVLDADVIADPTQVRAAIELCSETGVITLAYERFVGLGAAMTKKVLAGWQGDWDRGARFRSQTHESSIVVIPRSVWDEIGGFDERFVGWGQEDVAFIHAARVLTGSPRRVPGTVWHLWHPRSVERDSRTEQYRANQDLGRTYRFTREPAAMRELLEGRLSARAREFRRIFQTNAWNGADTKAGPGSSLEATKWLQASLAEILAELGASSVLDAGCSESLWMPPVEGYVGVDIVPEAVAVARARHPDRDYRVADICVDELPSTDAIICRDTLQHLSLLDGLTALQNFRRTGGKWLLANTHRGGTNTDVPSGGWFEIDLEAAPFWLGEPQKSWPDGAWKGRNRYPNKVLGAWEL